LASVGFLVTFTIRSWHEGLWPLDGATRHAIVSTPRQPAPARETSVAASPFEPGPPLAAAPAQEIAWPRAARMPTVASAVTLAAAPDYLDARAREARHSSRMR